MTLSNSIQARQKLLISRYKVLMEQAYNLRQTDSALSDISEYKAIKLLHKLNKMKFLERDIRSFKLN